MILSNICCSNKLLVLLRHVKYFGTIMVYCFERGAELFKYSLVYWLATFSCNRKVATRCNHFNAYIEFIV